MMGAYAQRSSYKYPLIILLIFKLEGLFLRLWDVLAWFPLRFMRLVDHFWLGVRGSGAPVFRKGLPFRGMKRAGYWLLELVLLLLDMVGTVEIYETLADWLKFRSRPLKPWEKEAARQVFGKSINYRRVRVDESAWLGPRSFHFCYVSFYTVNSWGPLSNATLIHELTHIWQYQRLGIVYIPRALWAQHYGGGYDYGGVGRLRFLHKQGMGLEALNLEQQADLAADYFRLRHGYRLLWAAEAHPGQLRLFEHFAHSLR